MSPSLTDLILIGEKTSLADVLRPIAEEVGGELLLPTGEASDTMVAELAARCAQDGRPSVVLYFSDFDPSGRQMPVSVSRKLQALHDLLHPELDVRVLPVALTIAQVQELHLPSTPLKETERRADRRRAVMGHEQTEIDALSALNPGALTQIARDAIAPFYDSGLAARVIAAQQAWYREANGRLETHSEYVSAAGSVLDALDRLRGAESDLRAAQSAARDAVEDVEPPEIILPKAELTGEQPSPLFTTEYNFAGATQKLIDYKQLNTIEPNA